MKALSMRISAVTIALGGLFYFLACSPATQNNNSGQGQNLATNQTNGNVAAKDLEPCRDYGTDPGGTHAQGIKKGIKDKMSNSLKKLLRDPTNPRGTFTLEVEKAQGNAKYFIAKVTGKVSGDDNLKELGDILNDFQDKEECLRVVYFFADGALTSDPGDGFEWSACEHPMVVCPNGECCMPTATNTNTNMNSNTNTNANTNANANRSGNRNN